MMYAVESLQDNDDAIIEKINQIDLDPVIKRMTHIYHWEKNKTLIIAKQYKNFLFLKKKYGSRYDLPPSIEIDEFWHNHILYTEKYQIDCQQIFNEFFHHYPSNFESSQNNNIAETFENETQALYFKEFGEYLYETRPISFLGKFIGWIGFLFNIKRKYN